ncbi:MAG TPA: TetR family transcriptional regulator [Firmicutes bacterium]|jgi:AcrR family transcriptional regulator|nr:TetR family transcriptional regulator [Bacillota bacterium]
MPPRPGLDTQMILTVAAHIADELDVDQMTLNTLAEHLGVKTPSLYNHISGLSDLRQKLAVYALQELSGRLAEAAIGKSKDDALRAIIYAHRTFVEERPGLYEALCRCKTPSNPAIQNAVERLKAIIGKILEPYNLQEDQLSQIIKIVRSMVHGFVTLRSVGSFGGPSDPSLDPDNSFELMVDIFFAGFHQMVDPPKE